MGIQNENSDLCSQDICPDGLDRGRGLCGDPWCCCCLVTRSCLTLCDLMDCSPPGSSVRGIFQARVQEQVAISSSRESSQLGIELTSPALARGCFTAEPPGTLSPRYSCTDNPQEVPPGKSVQSPLRCEGVLPGCDEMERGVLVDDFLSLVLQEEHLFLPPYIIWDFF